MSILHQRPQSQGVSKQTQQRVMIVVSRRRMARNKTQRIMCEDDCPSTL